MSSGLGAVSGLAPPLRARFLDPRLSRTALTALMLSFIRDVEEGRHRDAGWPTSAYRVSEVGLNALVRILTVELSPREIRVDAVCPGWVRTDMGGADADRSVEQGAASVLAAAPPASGASGGCFRDGRAIPW